MPKLLKTSAIPVAVVRSFGGNQAEDKADGAEKTIIPAIPFSIAHMWHILQSQKRKLILFVKLRDMETVILKNPVLKTSF